MLYPVELRAPEAPGPLHLTDNESEGPTVISRLVCATFPIRTPHRIYENVISLLFFADRDLNLRVC